MRITDEARELHKDLKAKNVDITREQILEVLKTQSENGQYKLSRGEPFEIYRVGTITPKLKVVNGTAFYKDKEKQSGKFTTVTFSFKIAPEIKKEAKSRIPKV
jgi:hypothetical protein